MKGTTNQDLVYCEVFVDFPEDPMEVCLSEGTTLDLLAEVDDTYLVLLEDEEGTLYYGNIAKTAFNLTEKETEYSAADCDFYHYVNADPYGSSQSGDGCLRTGGHCFGKCPFYRATKK